MSGQDMRKLMEMTDRGVIQPTLTIRDEWNNKIAEMPIITTNVDEIAEELWPKFSSWYEYHMDEYDASGAADAVGRPDAAEWAYAFPDFGVIASAPQYERLAEQVLDILWPRATKEFGVMENITIDYE